MSDMLQEAIGQLVPRLPKLESKTKKAAQCERPLHADMNSRYRPALVATMVLFFV